MAKLQGRRQSKNVEDRRPSAWSGEKSDWQTTADVNRAKEYPIPARVNQDFEVARMRDRMGREMQDKIKNRTRISNATYAEIVKKRKTK